MSDAPEDTTTPRPDFDDPEHHAWRRGLCSAEFAYPVQGDTRYECDLRVDLNFGGTAIYGNSEEHSDEGDDHLADIRIKACLMRLELEGCRRDASIRMLGALAPDDPRNTLREKTQEDTRTETELAAGAEAALNTSGTVRGGVSAEASARRQSIRQTERAADRVLQIKAVEPYGGDQWIIYDLESDNLSGLYAQGMDQPVCRVNSSSGAFSAQLLIMCYASDVRVDLHVDSSLGPFWRRATLTQKKLIEIAIKQGLQRDQDEPGLLRLASSKIRTSEQV